MKTARCPEQAALVITWPNTAAEAAAREAARRVAAHGIPATWALDQPSQVEMLAAWGAARGEAEAALLVTPDRGLEHAPGDEAASRELGRRLDLLRAAGLRTDVVHGGRELLAAHWPRTLRALGVHGVVAEGGDSAAAHALPFGVWHFAPHASAPRVRRWTDWFRGPRPMFAGALPGPTVVTIDLARVGAVGSRGWREMEAAIDEAAHARRTAAVTLVTIGALTAQFTQANAPRPQRSILRAA